MKLKDFDFRIWNKKENEFVNIDCPISFKFGERYERQDYVHFTCYIYEGGIRDKEHTWIAPLFYENDDLELELFTGLYDKNHRKIYEGDIIKYVYIFKHELLREDIIEKLPKKLSIGYIGFDNFLGFRVLKNKELQCFMKDITDIEVVGNIHENEDLLNTKE